MTEIKELIEKLKKIAENFSHSAKSNEKFDGVWLDMAAAERRQADTLHEAASALEALISRSAVMEEALRPFAAATLLNQSAVIVAGDGITQAFDSGKKHVTCLMEEDAGPAFNRARSALSLKAGKE